MQDITQDIIVFKAETDDDILIVGNKLDVKTEIICCDDTPPVIRRAYVIGVTEILEDSLVNISTVIKEETLEISVLGSPFFKPVDIKKLLTK